MPAADAPSGMGRHDMVAPVGQQVHFRELHVRIAEYAHGGIGVCARRRRCGTDLGSVGVQRRPLPGHSLLQQQFRSPCLRIGHETALHGLTEQHMGEGKQAHTLMVRHEGPYDDVRLAMGDPRGCVINGLIEAIGPDKTLLRQYLQIAA